MGTQFTKKDIERARKRLLLKQAQEQLGMKIKSLKQVKIIKKVKKNQLSLGERLEKINKRRGF